MVTVKTYELLAKFSYKKDWLAFPFLEIMIEEHALYSYVFVREVKQYLLPVRIHFTIAFVTMSNHGHNSLSQPC